MYLNSHFYFRKGNRENYQKALDELNQAVALDPNFSLAYANMPVVYYYLSLNGADPKEMLAKGRAAAQKTLELDETLSAAHSAMAGIKQDEWDWPGAENEYRRAIELNPNSAASRANHALFLALMGRTAEALAENKRAEEIDPLNIFTKTNDAEILYWARRYDDAIQVAQSVVKIQPDFSAGHSFLGYAYAMKGQYYEAIGEYQKKISLDGETPSTLSYLGYAYARSGKRDQSLAILDKLKTMKASVSGGDLAVVYAGLDNREAALASLERAYKEHDPGIQGLRADPHYDSLRSDPRFQELARRMRLPK